MNLEKRLEAFVALGKLIACFSDNEITSLSQKAQQVNPWFTQKNVQYALEGITTYLDKTNLAKWLQSYPITDTSPKNIGVVMAGNIPMVGFHDFLVTMISGNNILAKLSAQDSVLMPYLIDELIQIEPEFKQHIRWVEHIKNPDAIIATGSNNTSRYFEYYFSKYPHIIRKSRTSCALLTGEESSEQLSVLSQDIFQYFGLGCRNVSKIYVPENYNFEVFIEALIDHQHVMEHHKYVNNYDYQKSLLLVNGIPHFDTGALLIKEDPVLHSPISVLHYETYKNMKELENKLTSVKDQIQCTVGDINFLKNIIPFGSAQNPQLWDYADNVDTLKFILNLSQY